MRHGSTIFLRGAVYLLGVIVLALCMIVLPHAISAEMAGDFDYGLIFVGIYVPAVPFLAALHQALKLLGYIDKNSAFSSLSVKALRNIKYCAAIISALFTAGMPYIFYIADRDDAPGVAAIGFVIIFVSLVIATAAGVFQGLLQNAVDIKSENDLTV